MDLSIFFEPMAAGDPVWGAMLISGLGWTLAVAALSWILAFVLGSLVGIARTSEHRWLAFLGGAYVELFRNIPLLVQFFLWYFVVPGVIPAVKTLVIQLDPIE
jgi:glutamate/aspartate transport system permease protein